VCSELASQDLTFVFAAKHLQQKGLDEADAQKLATAFSEKLSPPLKDAKAIDVSVQACCRAVGDSSAV
jgi:hypothetical protein